MGVLKRAVLVAAGVGVAVLAAGGCGQPGQPVAVVSPPTEAPAEKPPSPVAFPPKEPDAQPAKPVGPPEGAQPPVAPAPSAPFGGRPVAPPTFVPPTSPTFIPPPVDKPASDLTAIGPKPADPPPVTPPEPKPTDPPKPTEPAKDPKKVEYPDKINGKDLKWHLEQTSPRFQRDPQMREAAIRTIPAFGPSARQPAINPIIDAIQDDPDPGVKIAAITIISNMGFDIREHIKPTVNVLVRVLRNTGRGSALRVYCIRSLASFGADALVSVPDLRNMSTPEAEPSWETRLAIAEALGYIGAPSKKDADPSEVATKTLLDYQLRDPCVAVKLEAVKSLLTLGPPKPQPGKDYPATIKPYLESVEKLLKVEGARGNDKGVYVWLLLLQIMYDGTHLPENVKKVAKLIETPDGPNAANLRLAALQVLSVLGPPASPAVPQIIPALTYPEIELQMGAMVCLARIGNEARAAVNELEKLKNKPLEPKPKDAYPDWKPDDRLQKMAADTIDYITGKKKIVDAPPPPDAKKDDKK